MSAYLKLLISSVLLLSLGVRALAEDETPPEFAGADGWCAAVWEFDVEPPEPTAFGYNPEADEPEFLMDGVVEDWWIEVDQTLEPDGEGRFYLPAPEGNGGTMTMSIQITWEGDGDVWAFPEVWSAPDDEGGEYLGGNEGIDPEIIDLGDGMSHGTWFGAVSEVAEYVVALIGAEGVVIHELVVDAVIHDGAAPVGTGRRPGGPGQPGIALDPNPEHEVTDVPLDAVLNWTAGQYAVQHDVYFGTNFLDVNEASADGGPQGAYKGRQAGTQYPAVGDLGLDYGVTYFWRIDEVNGAPDFWVYKGSTWQFTAEPFAYPAPVVAATASSSVIRKDPEDTINETGMVGDLHSTNTSTMWLSDHEPAGAWILYEFDKVYKLHELWVWNYNGEFPLTWYGLKDVTIQYSIDGVDYATLGTTHEFTQAPGTPDYARDTVIDFDGAVAKYVKLSCSSNHSNNTFDQYGLAEVRFLYKPLRARGPNPADGAEDVGPDTVLSWRAGREAALHEVYLGTDMQAVADGTVPAATVFEASYDAGTLELDATYYWRVNEANDAETPRSLDGEIWSFSTPEYLVVEDFEDYDDYDNRIFQTWIDGFGFNEPPPGNPGNDSGSTVGYTTAPFAEQDIVHGGGQSMPFEYDNSATPFYSETDRTFDTPQDWTKAGVKGLTLYFHGDAENGAGAAERMYVALGDSSGHIWSVPYDGDVSDIKEEYWQEWNVDLKAFSDNNVNLASVQKIYIGVGNRVSPQFGGTGKLYFDDIRLYPPRCVAKHRPTGDVNRDCLVNFEDFRVMTADWGTAYDLVEYNFNSNNLTDSSGNNYNGIGVNGPSIHDGILTLDGTNYVDIPLGQNNPFDGSRDFSIAMDFRTKQPSILISSARDIEPDNHAMSVFVHHWDEPYWGEVIYDNFWVGSSAAEDDPLDGEWHTMVVSYDADSGWVTVYLDGAPGDGADMSPDIPDIGADTVRVGGSLNTEYPYEEGVGAFSGDIDNVRIYRYALTHQDVLSLPATSGGPADLSVDNMVDFKDLTVLADTWLDERLWP